MDKQALTALFEKYIKKLRITPAWDIKLEFVEDPTWRKTGDFKIDCDDRKAILLLNAANPKQENLEEVIVHELMHIKMYPPGSGDGIIDNELLRRTDRQRANLPINSFSAPLSRRLRSCTKCFLLEFGENRGFLRQVRTW